MSKQRIAPRDRKARAILIQLLRKSSVADLPELLPYTKLLTWRGTSEEQVSQSSSWTIIIVRACVGTRVSDCLTTGIFWRNCSPPTPRQHWERGTFDCIRIDGFGRHLSIRMRSCPPFPHPHPPSDDSAARKECVSSLLLICAFCRCFRVGCRKKSANNSTRFV